MTVLSYADPFIWKCTLCKTTYASSPRDEFNLPEVPKELTTERNKEGAHVIKCADKEACAARISSNHIPKTNALNAFSKETWEHSDVANAGSVRVYRDGTQTMEAYYYLFMGRWTSDFWIKMKEWQRAVHVEVSTKEEAIETIKMAIGNNQCG